MTQAYLRTNDAAKYLGVSVSTMERRRLDGTGPKFRRLGARIVTYAIADLDAWASGQVLMSTSEAA